VKQEFGPGIQPHVVLAFADEAGKWNYVDPGGNLSASHPDTGIPVGQAPASQDETWYDPLDANPSLGLSAMTPELLSFGRSPEVEIVKSFGALSVAGSWDPVTASDFTLNPGDAVRGSFDFDAVESAMYSGPDPWNYLRDIMPKLFDASRTTGFWSIWKPGDGLPADWPASDTKSGNYRFRSLNVSSGPITYPVPSAGGTMKLWISRGNINGISPPGVVADNANTPPDQNWNPVTNQNEPRQPPIESDPYAGWKAAGLVVLIGGMGYAGYRIFARRGRR
jgi:hypothetical protein